MATPTEASGPGAVLSDDQTLVTAVFSWSSIRVPALAITERAHRKTAAWFWCLLRFFGSGALCRICLAEHRWCGMYGGCLGVCLRSVLLGPFGQGADRHFGGLWCLWIVSEAAV